MTSLTRLTLGELQAQVLIATHEYQARAKVLAVRARTAFVIPFCESTGLEFSKNGVRWHFGLDEYPYGLDAEKLEKLPDTKNLVAVLRTEIMWEEGLTLQLPALMQDYTPISSGRVSRSPTLQSFLDWGFVRRIAV